MIYVSDSEQWEYRVLLSASHDPQRLEHELNTLGRKGWELASVVAQPDGMLFYLKRITG